MKYLKIIIIIIIMVVSLSAGDSLTTDLSIGREIYNTNCSGCHGINGDGKGTAAKYLTPSPRDFTQGKFELRTTPSGSLPLDKNLAHTIKNGIKRTAMPSWEGILDDNDIGEVIAYIKTFSEKFLYQEPYEELVLPSIIPETTEKSRYEGRMIYILMECWNCHGSYGGADGPSTKTLKDDWGNPLMPPDFRYDPFEGGDQPIDVYRTFSTGLTGTPMPAYGEDLFGFARENLEGDYSNLEKVYSPNEILEFEHWIDTLITEDELYNLPEEEMYKIFLRRKWSLIHYVLSLKREHSIVYKLFYKDYELTR